MKALELTALMLAYVLSGWWLVEFTLWALGGNVPVPIRVIRDIVRRQRARP